MMVVFQHAYFQIDAYAPFLAWRSAPAAVDIFFMVSGVIMTVTTVNGTAGDFLLRRILRIVPLYWLFTFLLVGIYLIAPGKLHSTVITPETLVKSLLFLPHYNLGHPQEIWPILVPGWTLNYEMFFYLVFALLLVFPVGQRIALAAAIFSLLFMAGALLDGYLADPVLRTYSSPWLLDFVVGMLIGYAYLQRARIAPWLAWLLAGSGTALIAGDFLAAEADGIAHLSAYAVPAAFVVLGGVLLDLAGRMRRSKLLLLGDASYSLYLSHLVTLGALRIAWSRLGLVGPSTWHAHAFALAGLAAAAAVGCAIHLLVERRLLRAGQRLGRGLRSRRAQRVVAAGEAGSG